MSTEYLKNNPLMIAAKHGEVRIAELLVAKTSNLNAKNTRGEAAVMMATARGHIEIVRDKYQ